MEAKGGPVLERTPRGWRISAFPRQGDPGAERPRGGHLPWVLGGLDGTRPGGDRRTADHDRDRFGTTYPRTLTPGGLLAVHNAIRQTGAMQNYLDLVRTHPDFDTVTVSATLDDGFCLSYRHRKP